MRRRAWFKAQPDLGPHHLVFIDETGPRPKWLGCAAAARTMPQLWDVTGRALPTYTPAEGANHFTAAGYEPD